MANPLTVAGFPDVLDPRFFEVSKGQFEKESDIIDTFYTKRTPTQLTERGTGLTPMDLVPEFNGAITYDGPDQAYDWNVTMKEFALGTQIERLLVEFDQFDVIEDQWRKLADAAFRTRQTYAIRIFTQAFNLDTAFDYNNTEGVALCSDSHTTTRAGVSTTSGFDNLTTAELSPTALKAAYIQYRRFKDLAGNPIGGHEATHLVVPVDLRDRADEITATMRGLDSADSNKNVLEGRYKVVDLIRLTDTNNWFLTNLSMFKSNNFWFDKQSAEFSRLEDFDTIVAKYRVYQIYAAARNAIWQYILGASVS
jgi:hypothetical protein